VISAGAAGLHTVIRAAAAGIDLGIRLGGDAWHAAAHLGGAVASFMKNHAPAIGSFLGSAAVFAGCEAVLGAAAGAVGAISGEGPCTANGSIRKDLGQFGKGFTNTFTSAASGALHQFTSNMAMAGSCATGSLSQCWNIVNPLGPMSPVTAGVNAIVGAVSTGQSIYDQYQGGQGWYASGRITGYAALIALTRGLDFAPEAAGTGVDAAAARGPKLYREGQR
jgi:hypothetical protein